MHVDFDDRAGYLAAHLSGQYSLPGMLGAIDRIAEESEKRHSKRVLVEVWITGDAPIADRYQYAEHAARVLRHLEKSAACAGPDQRVEPFTEDTARNRGLRFRVFGDLQEATRWLVD